ncbi:MAG: hypothetical protein K9H64_12665 [Bacteroidales bacterium]|nr:hypothetical protein [Bacteroidales bacterium]MCF8456900.1 hypothetical protein [Bacteroidales bacterium]
MKKAALVYLILITTGFILVSCQTTNNKENRNNQSTKSDYDPLVELAGNKIFSSLKNNVIYENSIQEDGDYSIVYSDDTTNVEQNDIMKEYCTVEKNTILVGDLNNDGIDDFAIRYICGPEMGNMFSLNWFIFLKSGNGWIQIENDFGGGRFGDIENIIEIHEGIIKTELFEFDKEAFSQSNNAIIKHYKLYGNILRLSET